MLRKMYMVHYKTNEYNGSYSQKVFVVADSKKNAESKFIRFAENYKWPSNVNSVTFDKVGIVSTIVT